LPDASASITLFRRGNSAIVSSPFVRWKSGVGCVCL